MRNQKVIDILHVRSLIQEMIKTAKLNFVSRDGMPPAQQILCPEAPYADRIVSQEAILDGLVLFELLVEQQDHKLSRYEIRERDTGALALPASITKETTDGKEAATEGSSKLKKKLKTNKPEPSSDPDPVGGGSKAP